jgi:flagellar M-ring protein FliF
VPGGGSSGSRGVSSREDETKNYEISKTVTHTITRGARLKKLSVAVLLDAPGGKTRPEAEMKRIEALAKSAVGFDAARGDQFQLTAQAFSRPAEDEADKPSLLDSPRIMRIAQLVGGVILLLIAAMLVSKMRAAASSPPGVALLKPGAKVHELEAMMDKNGGAMAALPPARPEAVAALAPVDPNAMVRDRARDLARQDPARAATLLKAWISADSDQRS